MTRDHIQVILLLGFLFEKGYCRAQLGSHLNINVELEDGTHELRGYVMESAPFGIKMVSIFSPDGKTVLDDVGEKLSTAVQELVFGGRQFCIPWRNYSNPPVILWTDCGRV